MNCEKFIGKTLGELAEQTGTFWRPVHIFVLQDENDRTGKRLMDVYSFRQVVNLVPAARQATVVFANDCCGEAFLRVGMFRQAKPEVSL